MSSTAMMASLTFTVRLFTTAIVRAQISLGKNHPQSNSSHPTFERRGMYLLRVWRAFLKALKDVDQHHLLAFAGSLAYYFFMSLIPFLIFLASLLVYIPISGLFDYILGGLSHMFPPDSMAMVRKVLADLINTNSKSFLSFGIVGTIWSASGGPNSSHNPERQEALAVCVDRKSTRLNSSHLGISYAVFC